MLAVAGPIVRSEGAEGKSPRQAILEKEQRFAKLDKRKLRHSVGMEVDQSKAMLKIPASYDEIGKDFIVAKEPPAIDFGLIKNLHPEFQADGIGEWTHWGEVTRGPNGKFYMGVGNHRKEAAGNVLYVIEYDPVKKEQRVVVDCGAALGWGPYEITDCMLHGDMNFMQDGRLVAATWLGHSGKENLPASTLAAGWRGSFVFTYDPRTGVTESHGIPMLNGTWAMHHTDPKTGVLMAVGFGYAEQFPHPRWNSRDTGKNYAARGQRYFLAYDVPNRKVLYAGLPPGDIDLSERATLIDHRTGIFYSSDSHNDSNFVSYDQRTNHWRDLACKVPYNPATGKNDILRCYTYRPTIDGRFYCMDMSGAFFTFSPEREETKLLGLSWGREGVYTASLAMSPGERYIYYVPDAHGHYLEYQQPVVQYDTVTGKKKVLAFLSPYYLEKYGYVALGSYGIELSEDGSLLVVEMNGTFGTTAKKEHYSHPAIFAIHIPESEREE